ncbi:MAG: NUDIX hydrolase [Chloroflexota bacterium]|nr:NUDIX hydrolase [Chloroflexota bacterium]
MEAETPKAPLFTLSSAVFAQRAGEILILKRASGEATGGWYLPGGAVDAGETVEESARRELFEEAGLVPSGPLTCVAVAHSHVYGHQSLGVLYAADCAEGDVVLSHEHTAARWIDPVVYRDRYFGDDVVQGFAASNPRAGEMLANISRALDSYLDWRALRGPA